MATDVDRSDARGRWPILVVRPPPVRSTNPRSPSQCCGNVSRMPAIGACRPSNPMRGLAIVRTPERKCCRIAVRRQTNVFTEKASREVCGTDIFAGIRQASPQVERRSEILDITRPFVPDAVASMIAMTLENGTYADFDKKFANLLRILADLKVGGERGIRTLGRVSPTHAFQACSFNHSDISPSLESYTCSRPRA
jgi:hypothetical protein